MNQSTISSGFQFLAFIMSCGLFILLLRRLFVWAQSTRKNITPWSFPGTEQISGFNRVLFFILLVLVPVPLVLADWVLDELRKLWKQPPKAFTTIRWTVMVSMIWSYEFVGTLPKPIAQVYITAALLNFLWVAIEYVLHSLDSGDIGSVVLSALVLVGWLSSILAPLLVNAGSRTMSFYGVFINALALIIPTISIMRYLVDHTRSVLGKLLVSAGLLLISEAMLLFSFGVYNLSTGIQIPTDVGPTLVTLDSIMNQEWTTLLLRTLYYGSTYVFSLPQLKPTDSLLPFLQFGAAWFFNLIVVGFIVSYLASAVFSQYQATEVQKKRRRLSSAIAGKGLRLMRSSTRR